jgi:hypothetical protein
MAEYYDQGQKRVRLMTVSQIEKIAGIWIGRRVEMSSIIENSRTILVIDEVRFNSGLKEDLLLNRHLNAAIYNSRLINQDGTTLRREWIADKHSLSTQPARKHTHGVTWIADA